MTAVSRKQPVNNFEKRWMHVLSAAGGRLSRRYLHRFDCNVPNSRTENRETLESSVGEWAVATVLTGRSATPGRARPCIGLRSTYVRTSERQF